jgi:hypothetical protein
MEALTHLLHGFAAALTPNNLLYAFVGCMLGTLIGVLPGLGTGGGYRHPDPAHLQPRRHRRDHHALRHLLWRHVRRHHHFGADQRTGRSRLGRDLYRRSPDGQTGRAGSALGIAAIGSFVGGTLATVALVAVAMPLASLALKFGPAEFFALMVAGLCLVVGLAGNNMMAALLMTVIGLLLRDDRRRSGARRAPLHLRRRGTLRRHRLRAGRHGPVRRRRTAAGGGEAPDPHGRAPSSRPGCRPERSAASRSAQSAAAPSWASCWG